MSDILDALIRARSVMADIPAEPFYGRLSVLPTDQAIRFEIDGRQFVVAHPAMWEKVDTQEGAVRIDGTLRPFCGVPVFDLDHDGEKRAEFAGAWERAMNNYKGHRRNCDGSAVATGNPKTP